MLQRLQGVTRAVFSSSASSAGREVATAADKKISSDETKLSVGSLRVHLKQCTKTRSRKSLWVTRRFMYSFIVYNACFFVCIIVWDYVSRKFCSSKIAALKFALKHFKEINHCTDQLFNNNTIGEKRFPVNEV